jgi:hypothetical protein
MFSIEYLVEQLDQIEPTFQICYDDRYDCLVDTIGIYPDESPIADDNFIKDLFLEAIELYEYSYHSYSYDEDRYNYDYSINPECDLVYA